jgi:hypothetical protein
LIILALPEEVLAEISEEMQELLSMITLRVDGTHTPVQYVFFFFSLSFFYIFIF